MKGQIILIGYGDDAGDKLLRVEVTYTEKGDDTTDVVRFPDLKVSISRNLLLDAIQFLKDH